MRRVLLAAIMAASAALRVPLLSVPRPTGRSNAPLLAAATSLEASVLEVTAASKVVIYSKSWCPFCAQAKQLFDEMGQPYTAIELDQREDGELLQATLLEMTEQRTVPNIFVNGQHLGGNDDTQRAARDGKLAALLKGSPGGVVPTGGGSGSGATAAQLKAVSENKMISETEALVRKVAGVGIGLVTAAMYAMSGMAYTSLAGGLFGAIAVYRTGAQYQWGCIAGSRWNVDGVLSMSEIPAEFADFVQAKRRELASNVISSSAAGVALANLAALAAGDFSLAVLGQTVQSQIPLIALTALASFVSGAMKK